MKAINPKNIIKKRDNNGEGGETDRISEREISRQT